MVRLVAQEWKIQVSKKDLLELEEEIIRTLDFELYYTCPVPFLERF